MGQQLASGGAEHGEKSWGRVCSRRRDEGRERRAISLEQDALDRKMDFMRHIKSGK